MNADAEKTLEAWAADWSSPDIEHLLSLFTDDCTYEDVTFGVVNRGKAELKAFANGIFAAFPRLQGRADGPVCGWRLGRDGVDHHGHAQRRLAWYAGN